MLLVMSGVSAQAAVLAPELERAIASGGHSPIPLLVTFHPQVDLTAFTDSDRSGRRAQVLRALKEESDRIFSPIRRLAEAHGGTHIQPLWAAHGMAVTAGPDLVRSLAALPDVASIRIDASNRTFPVKRVDRQAHHIPGTRSSSPLTTVPDLSGSGSRLLSATWSSREPEWNIAVVKGPDLWARGYTGQGTVIASLDTGVDGQHPDVAAQFRGGANSWYDPHGEHEVPADQDGHGTHAISLAVGRAGGGSVIGMAPDARWIAAKLFNDAGLSRESLLHRSLQWVLDPDGDVSTDDAPDIVMLSWAVADVNVCSQVLLAELEALRVSGVAVVLSAGNSGPGPLSSVSPANNPNRLSVGSVDRQLTVSRFSSRGPSACDGGIFPAVVAPGEQVVAADRSFGGMPLYATVTGTSFAAPHVAGALALLKSAVPAVPLPVIESALKTTSVTLRTEGEPSDAQPGLIDTLAAYRVILAETGSGTITDGSWTGMPEAVGPREVRAPRTSADAR